MNRRESAAMTWSLRAAIEVEASLEETLALARVARELMPLEALESDSLDPGFAFIMSNKKARRIMRIKGES